MVALGGSLWGGSLTTGRPLCPCIIYIICIDLGTTSSAIAVVGPDGRTSSSCLMPQPHTRSNICHSPSPLPSAAAQGTVPSLTLSRPLPSPTPRPTPKRPSRPARACRTAVLPPSVEQYEPAGREPAQCALAPACLVTAKRLLPPPEAVVVAEPLLQAEAAAVAVRVVDVQQVAVAVLPRLCRGRCCGPALIPSSRRS